MNVVLDEERHVYIVTLPNGSTRELPGITSRLRRVGILRDPEERLPPRVAQAVRLAMHRGAMVHKAAELGDDLDPESVDPRIAGYLESWRKFREGTGCAVAAAEMPVACLRLGYATRIDVFGGFGGDLRSWALDLKTGGKESWHALQTAAGVLALREIASSVMYVRGAVYLREDGGIATLERHDDRGDFAAWEGIAAAAAWKEAHGYD